MRWLEIAVIILVLGLMLFGVNLAIYKDRENNVIRDYNLVIGIPDNPSKILVQGTSIQGAGFCSEVMKGNRVDTRVCMPHLITEAAPTPEATPKPAVQEASR